MGVRDIIRRGGAKGLPHSMQAFYDAIDAAGGFQDNIQTFVNYPADLFVQNNLPQFLAVAPWAGEVLFIALINQRAIAGGQSDVVFSIVAGATLGTLDTGDDAIGSADTLILDPPIAIATGEIVQALSNGSSSGQSTVMVAVGLRST